MKNMSFLCLIGIHKNKLIKDTLKHCYYECEKCFKRSYKTMLKEGWQPLDRDWLNYRKY